MSFIKFDREENLSAVREKERERMQIFLVVLVRAESVLSKVINIKDLDLVL